MLGEAEAAPYAAFLVHLFPSKILITKLKHQRFHPATDSLKTLRKLSIIANLFWFGVVFVLFVFFFLFFWEYFINPLTKMVSLYLFNSLSSHPHSLGALPSQYFFSLLCYTPDALACLGQVIEL